MTGIPQYQTGAEVERVRRLTAEIYAERMVSYLEVAHNVVEKSASSAEWSWRAQVSVQFLFGIVTWNQLPFAVREWSGLSAGHYGLVTGMTAGQWWHLTTMALRNIPLPVVSREIIDTYAELASEDWVLLDEWGCVVGDSDFSFMRYRKRDEELYEEALTSLKLLVY